MLSVYTYAQAEIILAALHGAVGKAQRGAFRSRLKNLKKLGIPRGVSPGKGAKVQYRDRHLYEWAFALELAEFGIDPTVIVKLMERAWDDEILPRFHTARHQINGKGEDIYLVLRPNLAGASWDRAVDPFTLTWTRAADIQGVVQVTDSDAEEPAWEMSEPQMAFLKSAQRRAIILNVSHLVRLLEYGDSAVVFELMHNPKSELAREAWGDDAEISAPAAAGEEGA